jgi:hypothetical protein
MMEQERMSLQSSKISSESRPCELTGYRWKLHIRIPEQKATVTQLSLIDLLIPHLLSVIPAGYVDQTK